jgi:hypothetical protein
MLRVEFCSSVNREACTESLQRGNIVGMWYEAIDWLLGKGVYYNKYIWDGSTKMTTKISPTLNCVEVSHLDW